MTFCRPETPGSSGLLKYTGMLTVYVNMSHIIYWLSINFHIYLIFMNSIFFINNLFTAFSYIGGQASSMDLKYTHEYEWDTYVLFVERQFKFWLNCYRIIAEKYNDDCFSNTEPMSCMCKIDRARIYTVKKILIQTNTN